MRTGLIPVRPTTTKSVYDHGVLRDVPSDGPSPAQVGASDEPRTIDQPTSPEPVARKPKSLKRALWLLAYRRSTTEQVARYLAKRGFVGSSCNGLACPVAHYLQHETKNPTVAVGRWFATLFDHVREQRAELPLVVRNFITDYDHANFEPALLRALLGA